MRFLEQKNDGDFSLTEDFGNETRFAILSHTWGAEEVTFRDLIDGTGKSKTGFDKIRFCAQQAADDGLQYFWVDTCCIDKSSSAELQEAVNSMFRWYQNAVKCYVYLSDVSTRKRKASDQFSKYTWDVAFRSSRWFTRGWTLQELLAPGPDSIEFFSQEGERLGDKRTLEQEIYEITGIPIIALRGTPLSQFDINDRLSWAKNRQTTREEDKAYSLFGIFDIQIPLLYGEGKDKALKRLQKEIDKPSKGLDCLPYATDALFNSFNCHNELTCLPNTRVDLLQEIYNWADGQDDRCIFWLNGLAGTGKSTIARTIARRYFEGERLGASFFFSRGGGDVSHAGKFFTSIAVQLANNIPSLQEYIYDAITKRKDVINQSLSDQWHQLVLHPLLRLDARSSPSTYILLIDALDECDNEDHIRIILQLLAEARILKTVRLRIFLTSRPEIPIRHSMYQIPQNEHYNFLLHKIPSLVISHDIFVYLEYSLGIVGQEWSLGASWPGDQVLKQLVINASGIFIWAATAYRFIREGKQFATRRLHTILEGSSSTVTTPERHLNKIYTTVLKHAISSNYTKEEKEELLAMLKHTLGSIVVLLSPLSAYSLSSLIHLPKVDIYRTLEDLHAILDIPKDVTQPLHLHHPSFRDFLLNKSRCSDLHFWVDERQAHQTLVSHCIQLMSNSLKQDVCGQQAPSTLATDIESGQIKQCLPPEVQYACLYWIQHLQKSNTQLCDNDKVYQFLQVHLLHWLEALGWIGKTSESILALHSLEALILAEKCPSLYKFVYDAKRFALYNRLVIEQTPLQLYCSALVFAPEKSIIRAKFEKCIPAWIQRKPKVQAYWSTALQTLEGHSCWVTSVAFSPDGKQIVSGSLDNTIRLWDAVTGAALQTLEGHSSDVNSVAFSPDSKQIVSGSSDGTVRLWDAITGVALQTLEDDSSVYSVTFSPDSKQIVSGSHNRTVRLWDAITGVVLQTFKGHLNEVKSAAFSPDSNQIVSGSYDGTVRLWDAITGVVLQILKDDSRVYSVAFSPDSKQIVSGSYNGTVRLWDAITGASLQTLKGHLSPVFSVTFSSDCKQIASASSDETVRLWDAITGVVLQVLDGYSSFYSVAFSPDGKYIVSGSNHRTVQLWDAMTRTVLQTLEGHSGSVYSVAFSPDGKQVVSGMYNKTVQIWDTALEIVLQTLEGHLSYVNSVAFSPDGKQIVSGSSDDTIRLWDAITGMTLQTLEGHSGAVKSVAFSPNGKQIASASDDRTVRLWDAVTGATLQTLEGHSTWVSSVAFSPNGKQIASGSYDKTVRLWDAITGIALQTLKGHLRVVNSVTFSPDGKQIASASDDRTVRLWDAITGVVLKTLEGHSGRVRSVAFSQDGNVEQGLFILNDWVIEGKEKILWLPPDYRAFSMAVWNRFIVLGCVSGRISCLRFKER